MLTGHREWRPWLCGFSSVTSSPEMSNGMKQERILIVSGYWTETIRVSTLVRNRSQAVC
jgi:hypothetical protein